MEKESIMMEGSTQIHEEPLTFFLDIGDTNEKCGICCSPVTSRGVLDCCSHIYCFTCIDVWSAITNICPICKSQFKFITFIPCADLEDSSEADVQGDFVDVFEKKRDPDWNGGNEEDGSLPSYFIDEDAVVCLDGDGCRVRAGAADDGESGLKDTSVACNSCECWYHAICVGYKPESQKPWVCPRCSGILGFEFYYNVQENPVSSAKRLSPGKISNENILVDDCNALAIVESGETPVVDNLGGPENILKDFGSPPSFSESFDLPADTTEVCELETKTCISIPKLGSLPPLIFPSQHPPEKVCAEHTFVTDMPQKAPTLKENIPSEMGHKKADGKLDAMLSLGSSLNLSLSASTFSSTGLAASTSILDAKVESSSHPDHTSEHVPKMASDEPTLSNQETVSTNVVLDKLCIAQHPAENLEGGEAKVKDEFCLSKEDQSEDVHGKHMKNAGQKLDPKKREVSGTRALEPILTAAQDNLPRRKLSRSVSLQGHFAQEQQAEEEPFQHAVNSCMQSNLWGTNADRVATWDVKEENLEELSELVQGPEPKTQRNTNAKLATSKKGTTGTNDVVRTRRIVHRGSDLDGRTSAIVEQVRVRLKEAAGSGVLSKLGMSDLIDESLFAALKAAVVDSQVGMGRPLTTFQRATAVKKDLCDKDGVRQNLMRKLYGSSGKRRQAWDRDWDIAFWKERASKEKKARYQAENDDQNLEPELAQMERVIYDSKETTKAEADSILNRIYLADTSLLPRQPDIEPLGAQLISKRNSMPVQPTRNEGQKKMEKGVMEKLKTANGGKKFTAGEKDYEKSLPVSAAKSKTPDPAMSNACVPSLGSCQDLRTDKRKWALQVLARKTGQVAQNSVFNGKKSAQERLPLLVELPVHMRPVVEYDRRSKVPTSIRQIHLDRFVEYYLQKANLKNLNESAECKSAILAAESKEKEIYDSANSKGVYVNLCVQALHPSSNVENDLSTETEVITPRLSGASQIDVPNAAQDLDLAVERALKATGLISDSPNGSPCQEDSEDRLQDNGNVLDVENDPSLDIHGDLEFNLDDIGTQEMASNDESLASIRRYDSECKASGVKVVKLRNVVKDNPLNLPSPNNVLISKELDGTERKSVLSEVVNSVHDSQIIDGTDPERNGEVTLVSGQGEAHMKSDRFPGEDLERLVCTDDKNASEKGRSGFLETNDSHRETTLHSLIKQGNFDSKAGSSMPDGPLILDLPDDKLREGFEQYGSMLTHLAPEEEVSQQEVSDHALQSSGVDEHLQEQPSSSFLSVPGEGIFDQASNLHAKLEKISNQVERFIKEHIRPLHKSHVITTEQYRWAVAKTTSKVMQHHTQAKSANFLISEGDKVKRLAEQYLQAFKQHKRHVKK